MAKKGDGAWRQMMMRRSKEQLVDEYQAHADQIGELLRQRDAACAEIDKLKAENIRLGGASTMMKCACCERGVRPRDAVKGRCSDCARKYVTALVEQLEALEAELEELGANHG